MKKGSIALCTVVSAVILLAGCFTGFVIFTRGECAAIDYPDVKENESIASTYFSKDYATARENFRSASQRAGALREQIEHPVPGPDGQPLYTDIALLGDPEAESFLVLISGTHGVEGFAGSAVQVGLLESGIREDLPPGSGLLLIHAINPYGMAHLRRFNENSVDVNRNFRDHMLPPPRNRAYQELAPYIAPESMSLLSELAALAHLLWFRVTAGKTETKIAISGGQYTHPLGLFYGGRSESWSNTTLTNIVHRYLLSAKEVVAIDTHTALGSFGTAQLLPNVDPESAEHRYAKAIWDQSLFLQPMPDNSANSHLGVTVKSVMEKLLPGAKVASVTLEFGTFPSLDVFMALRAENWLHHHGDHSHSRSDVIKTCLLRTYYPDSEKWRLAVWRGGKDIVEQALSYLANRSKHH